MAVVQGGGLGMVAIGATLLALRSAAGDTDGPLALGFCIVGLLGVFAVGYPGYFVFNTIWQDFYYVPNITGKNAWLLGQAFFFSVYVVGAFLAFNTVRRRLDAVPAAGC